MTSTVTNAARSGRGGIRPLKIKPRRARNWTLWGGLGLSGLLILVSIAAQFWTPYTPTKPGVGDPLSAPSAAHLFGTDKVGSDIFSKVMAAGLTDIGITLIGVAIAFVIGTLIGALTGYFGGAVDSIVMRGTEIIQSFPALLLGMLLVSAVGGGLINVVIVVAILGFPGYLRLARAEILSKKSMEYADAAVLMGNGRLSVLFKHLLPNSLKPLVSFSAINASWVAIIVASLGFIGIGIEPGSAEWGSMIAAGRDQISNWWVTFFPGVAILLLAMAFYLLGDAFADREVQ
jgi:peptide/nickel transport system permease protein